MSDLISRQAAIDALRYAQHRFTVADEAGGMGTVKWSEDVIYFAAAERVLSELPSAQPENDVIDGNRKTLYLDDIQEALTHELESYPDYAREANGIAHAMDVIERLAEVKKDAHNL